MNELDEFLSSTISRQVMAEEAIHICCLNIIALYRKP
jgi:hypothetical protein